MKKGLILIIILFFGPYVELAYPQEITQPVDLVSDGPYIFNSKGLLKAKWIKENRLKEITLDHKNFNGFKEEFEFLFDLTDLEESFRVSLDYTQAYSNVDSICVLSDVHGEYSVYLCLLEEMGIIDADLNWAYGRGHLVLLGDVFDRGPQVTEIFWHLFGLEKQAANAGGHVHLLLGNHELMVLSEDLRYINPKYTIVEQITHTKYSDLYSANSVLGNWLRSKPVIITINDILFVHGGISMGVVRKELNIQEINQMFSENITGRLAVEANDNRDQLYLSEDDGPVWFRGYFTDKDFTEQMADSILNFYDVKHIVVGHTTAKGVRSIFDNKIIGVDAGISLDLPGQVLLYEDGSFFTGAARGYLIRLKVPH